MNSRLSRILITRRARLHPDPAGDVVLVVRVHPELLRSAEDLVVDGAHGRLGLGIHGRKSVDDRHPGAVAVVQRVADPGLGQSDLPRSRGGLLVHAADSSTSVGGAGTLRLDGHEMDERARRTARQRGYTVRSMHSKVAHAEGELERRLRAAARQSLGPDAPVVQVDAAVARTQQGPRRPRVGDDTYVRRLVKEETQRLEAAQFERWKS